MITQIYIQKNKIIIMKKILILVLFFSVQIIYSQFTLKGKITDTFKEPLVGVNIVLVDEEKGTTTDFDGNYELRNVIAGTYKIKVSFIGYDVEIKEVTFGDNSVVEFNVTLKESTEKLQEVEITGRRATTYKTEVSYSATRLGILLKETPVAVNTVTKELIRDLNITTLDDVVKNIPGVVSSGGFDRFNIRGFRNDSYFLINGAKQERSYWMPTKLPNIERVELLMGSSSALYGNASPGGSINLVTKKPLENSRNYLRLTSGSYETRRIEGDFTGPLEENKNLLFRLNTAYEKSNGQLQFGGTNSLFIAPSVTFRPNEKTNVNVEFIVDNFEGINDGATPVRKFNIENTPSNFSITQPSDYNENTRTSYNITLNHKFSDKLSLIATYLGSSYKTDLSEHTIWDTPSEGKYTLRYTKWDVVSNSNSFSAFLRGKYKISDNIEFNPIAGVDIYDTYYSSSYVVSIGESDGVETFDVENPVFKIRNTNDYRINSLSNNFGDDIRTQKTIGGYVQGHFKINSKLNIVLNARYEKYKGLSGKGTKSERETVSDIFLPRIAMNYELLKNLNMYANYSQGFEPVPNYFQPKKGEEGGFDKPMTSVTYETGLKGTFFKNRLAATLSAYYIPRENVVIRSVINRAQYVQKNEVSRGLELSANGKVTPNWNFSISYAYNHIKVTKDPEEGLSNKGQIIANEGKQKIENPFFIAGMFTKYKITEGSFRGVAFGLGGNYVSERRSSFSGFIYPSYLIANANVYYNVGKFEMAFILNNVLGEKYVKSGFGTELFFGQPRNYNFSVGYRF